MKKQWEYYPLSPLRHDGIAWVHFQAMWGLHYRNCNCNLCKRALEILDEAKELNKPVAVKAKEWL
jgi:hypothetical protein